MGAGSISQGVVGDGLDSFYGARARTRYDHRECREKASGREPPARPPQAEASRAGVPRRDRKVTVRHGVRGARLLRAADNQGREKAFAETPVLRLTTLPEYDTITTKETIVTKP